MLESTTYPGTTRTSCSRCSSGLSGLTAGEDFFLAFSPERVDPGRMDHTTKTVPKVVGGIDEPRTERAAALYGAAIDTIHRGLVPRGGRADEAAREHLPLRQHRARQRARPALRPDGDRHLGGRRRGRDQAVRLHALRARARPRRTLHPDRPVLPDLEGARVRLLRRGSSSLRARSTRTCRTTAARGPAGAEPRRGKSLKGSKILVLGVAYKADISDMRESPAVKLIELLQNAGADVSYHDPHVPSFTEHGLSCRCRSSRSLRRVVIAPPTAASTTPTSSTTRRS